MNAGKTLEHIELEFKYRIDPSQLMAFKSLAEKMPNLKEFIYAEGSDEYYKNGSIFQRYRKEDHKGQNGRAELTLKVKPDGAKNNIFRPEYNLRVDGTPKPVIVAYLETLGFKYNFTVFKSCHIYVMDDATLVMYSVADTTDGSIKNMDNFLEIEVSEEKIHKMTLDQAWSVLLKYEKALDSIGISSQKRLKKSLLEMYKRDV